MRVQRNINKHISMEGNMTMNEFYMFENIKRGLLMLTFVLFALSGCHMMEGAGIDVQQAGRALESSAEGDACCYHRHPH